MDPNAGVDELGWLGVDGAGAGVLVAGVVADEGVEVGAAVGVVEGMTMPWKGPCVLMTL